MNYPTIAANIDNNLRIIQENVKAMKEELDLLVNEIAQLRKIILELDKDE